MMLFDRKKSLNQIMGAPPKKEEEHMDPSHALAKEAIEAVHAHDHDGFINASRALFTHFGSQHDGNASEDHD